MAQGAEVIIGGGVHTTIAAMHGLREVDGAIIQDTYGLLARFAEAAAAIKASTGQWTSRSGIYAKPPLEVLRRASEMHGIEVLRDLVGD